MVEEMYDKSNINEVDEFYDDYVNEPLNDDDQNYFSHVNDDNRYIDADDTFEDLDCGGIESIDPDYDNLNEAERETDSPHKPNQRLELSATIPTHIRQIQTPSITEQELQTKIEWKVFIIHVLYDSVHDKPAE